MVRILVVGGGISGLTVAYRLQERLPNGDIQLLEQQSRLGGTIDTIRRDGFLVEGGPNGFPDNNPSTLDLARNLDLGGELLAASESASRNRFLLLGERLRKLPSSFASLLTTNLLGWGAKFRLFTERFRKAKSHAQDESIDAFARRRLGNEIADTFVDAFVTGILAGDPKLLSVAASFPRLVGWERDHGSILRGMAHARRQRRLAAGPQTPRRAGTMWSFQGGLHTLVDALSGRLTNRPVVGVSVRRISRRGDAWRVEAEGRDAWTADAVVLCCPAFAQAEILADLDPPLAEQMAGIAYNRVAVVGVGYRRDEVSHSLDGFGYLSPQRKRRDVLGVQWCSSIFPGRAPAGMVLLRAMCGGWHRGEMVDWDQDRLVNAVRQEMRVALDITAPPRFVQVVRWHRAIPQYQLGHLARVTAIEQRVATHPGLFVGGNSYRGVALNDCVEQSSMLSGRVVEWLRSARNVQE